MCAACICPSPTLGFVLCTAQVEYVWDLILSTSKDIHSSMEKRKGSLIPKKSFGRIERRDLKLALALQFMTRGKELRRLEKIGKEFEEFLDVAERKRWDHLTVP